IVETLIAARGAAGDARLRNARVPDERHLASRGQRAAAFERDDAVERGLAVGARGGEALRQAGVVSERLARPAIVAEAGQYLGRGFARQHVERDLLTDAVDRAIAVAADRGAVGGDVGRDEENLLLLDPAAPISIAAADKHRARRGAAGVEREAAVARDRDAARGGEPVAQL